MALVKNLIMTESKFIFIFSNLELYHFLFVWLRVHAFKFLATCSDQGRKIWTLFPDERPGLAVVRINQTPVFFRFDITGGEEKIV